MSRVGLKPIEIPDGVELKANGTTFNVKGKLGELSCDIPESIAYQIEDGVLTFSRKNNRPDQRSFHGLARALVNNCVVGVTEGFFKELEIEGTGYKWEVRGKQLVMQLGYSHPVELDIPEGITVEINGGQCKVSGIDKQAVGFLAATIKGWKPVEPYKGKGIRYKGQYVIRKAGKTGA